MDDVSAALGDDADLTRLPELGVVEHAVCANLGDRFRRGKRVGDRRVARGRLHRNAIDRDLGLERERPLQRERAMIGLDAGKRADDVESAGTAGGGSRVHRQVKHVGGVVGSTHARVIGVDRRNLAGGDLHLGLDVAGHELRIDPEFLTGGEVQIGSRPSLEAITRDQDRVLAGLAVVEHEVAGSARG